jgi:hypothetical protein
MTNEPREWSEDDVLSLIANKAQESLTLEFKACDALANKSWKTELAKDVSAFANSAGGTIIYGVKEDEDTHEADSIDNGYDPREISKERLEQIINSNIHRRIEGIRYNAIMLNQTRPGRVLYAIHVPESARAPHMANHRFYKRFAFESVPMEEYEVRERYRRETYPSKDIIRAWFDDAINPMISALASEEDCLCNEHWTWNHFDKAFHGLSQMGDSLNSSANQEDFLGRHAVIQDGLAEHDNALVLLNAKGASLFNEVANSSYLRDVFSRATAEDSLRALKDAYPHKFRGNTSEEIFSEIFGSSDAEQERLVWLAEYSINRTKMLQNDSRMPFWTEHREEFFQVSTKPPLSEYRAGVVEARKNLSRINKALIASLKSIRRELSEHHGVPFNESRWVVSEQYGLGLGGYTRYRL